MTDLPRIGLYRFTPRHGQPVQARGTLRPARKALRCSACSRIIVKGDPAVDVLTSFHHHQLCESCADRARNAAVGVRT